MSQQMKEGEDNKDVTSTIEEKELQKRSRQLQLPNTLVEFHLIWYP